MLNLFLSKKSHGIILLLIVIILYNTLLSDCGGEGVIKIRKLFDKKKICYKHKSKYNTNDYK